MSYGCGRLTKNDKQNLTLITSRKCILYYVRRRCLGKVSMDVAGRVLFVAPLHPQSQIWFCLHQIVARMKMTLCISFSLTNEEPFPTVKYKSTKFMTQLKVTTSSSV
jgi:hypothetical protein